MKISTIEVVKIDYPPVANPTKPRSIEKTDLTPDPTPMGKYPEYRMSRSTWAPQGNRDVGCIVTAEDGTWGFGMTDYGRPTAAIIEDWFAPKLVGESVLATEKIYDLMVRIASPVEARSQPCRLRVYPGLCRMPQNYRSPSAQEALYAPLSLHVSHCMPLWPPLIWLPRSRPHHLM